MKRCETCRHTQAPANQDPCRSCRYDTAGNSNWEAEHPAEDAFEVPAMDGLADLDDFGPAQVHPLATQVGGSHYKDMAIQPLVYVMANGLPFVEGSVVKYVSRWRKKGGVQDLKKARHLLDALIEKEETHGA